MLGISVVPLNLRRTLESIPLGLLQFVCETNNITTPGGVQIECYNNSTQSSKKEKILVPSQTQIHKKFISSLLRRKNQEENRKREEEQEAAEDKP